MPYVPSRGDVVWLDFQPQAGHEQAGRRPALVISPKAYNARVGLALFCPLTRKIKGYPFEVVLPDGSGDSAVLVDQVKSLDWRARNAEFHSTIPSEQLDQVLAKLQVLIAGNA